MEELNVQLLITGAFYETKIGAEIQNEIGKSCFSLAGELSLEEFITLIKYAPLIISVNTSTIHIAAACNTPVIVLYALTNPQHAPWRSYGKILPFSVPMALQSKNEVIRYVQHQLLNENKSFPSPDEIKDVAKAILIDKCVELIPEIVMQADSEVVTIGKFSWLPAPKEF